MSVDEVFEEFTGKEEPSKEEKPTEPKKEEPTPKVEEKPEASEEDFFGEGEEETKEEAVEAPPIEVKKEEAKEEPTEKPKEKPTEPKKEAPEEKDEFFGEEAEAEEKPLETSKAESDEFFGEEEATEEAPIKVEKPKPQATEEKFDVSDAKSTAKIVFMVYGLKGDGKTFLTFSFPGTIFCLSFDRKSLPIKEKDFKNDPRITVKDSIRYLDKSSSEGYLESCDKTFRYVNYLLSTEATKSMPDWIMVDGSDIFSKICEMTMRYRNNLMPFQGIKNRNLWKERNLYVSQIHNLTSKIAKKGVIYSAYLDKHEVVEEGEFIIKEDIPKWFGDIMTETDVVIRVVAPFEKAGKRFYAIVQSSKSKLIPTGLKKDVTDVGIKALIQKEG